MITNKNVLFLDGVYVERPVVSVRFRWVKAPTSAELTDLAHSIAQRVGRFLERRGLLERDADDCMDAGGRATQGAVAENSYLSGQAMEAGPLENQPFAIAWDTQVWDLGHWVIVKDAPNREKAWELLRFSTTPEQLPKLTGRDRGP